MVCFGVNFSKAPLIGEKLSKGRKAFLWGNLIPALEFAEPLVPQRCSSSWSYSTAKTMQNCLLKAGRCVLDKSTSMCFSFENLRLSECQHLLLYGVKSLFGVCDCTCVGSAPWGFQCCFGLFLWYLLLEKLIIKLKLREMKLYPSEAFSVMSDWMDLFFSPSLYVNIFKR